MIKSIFKDKTFLKTILVLALPIVVQNLITSSLNLTDNLMIGSLGEKEIASVGLANQYFFLFMLTMIGINGGASIFMSQCFGKKDLKSIKRFLGIDLTIGFIASFVFSILAFFFPEFIMKIFTTDIDVINLGVGYLKVVSLSYILTNVTLAYSSALRSTGQTKIPMYGSLIGLIANFILNWTFIFGKFGLPAMGVNGAALGTTIARTLEMSFILIAVYSKKNIVSAKLHELNFNFSLLKTYFITSTPVILNDVMWSLGTSLYLIAYGKLGVSAVATIQIANTVNNMFNIFGIGLAVATSIMIGNKIGANKNEVAIDYSHKLSIFTTLLGIIMGLLVLAISPLILSFFKVTQETYISTNNILKIMALLTPLRFFNIAMIIGVFRGGGDVNYAIFTELMGVWAYAIPIAFLSSMFFNLSVVWVYILISGEEVIKFLISLPRFKSNKWIKNVTDNLDTNLT